MYINAFVGDYRNCVNPIGVSISYRCRRIYSSRCIHFRQGSLSAYQRQMRCHCSQIFLCHNYQTLPCVHKRKKEKERERSDETRRLIEKRETVALVVVDADDDRTRLPFLFSTLETNHPRRRDHTTEGCKGRINTRHHPPVETCKRTTLECLASTSPTLSLCHPFRSKNACVAESGNH